MSAVVDGGPWAGTGGRGGGGGLLSEGGRDGGGGRDEADTLSCASTSAS
jgi:hypothetical protein